MLRPALWSAADGKSSSVQVLGAMEEYYREYNSNVHRGVHALSARATTAYEEARDKVHRAKSASETSLEPDFLHGRTHFI